MKLLLSIVADLHDESRREWAVADDVSYELAFEMGCIDARWPEKAPKPWPTRRFRPDYVEELELEPEFDPT